jgi:hypothetical protein
MARDQIENPRGHTHIAPRAEIREQPPRTLRWFTIIMAAAFAVPSIGVLIAGLTMGRWLIGLIGGLLAGLLFCGFFAILWKIMFSRGQGALNDRSARDDSRVSP